MSHRRMSVSALGAAVAVTLLTGCATYDEAGSNTTPCSPQITRQNQNGTLSAQQFGRGTGIQWGVYPARSAVRYVADTYVDKTRIEHKDQNYPPHGSVPASKVKTGQVFFLSGEAYDARGNAQFFYLRCRSA